MSTQEIHAMQSKWTRPVQWHLLMQVNFSSLQFQYNLQKSDNAQKFDSIEGYFPVTLDQSMLSPTRTHQI